MALKALMLKKRLTDATKALEEIRGKDSDFEARELELTKAIEEAETDEERAAVEAAINEFDSEKESHEEEKGKLDNQIRELEKELEAEEEEQETPADYETEPEKEEREDTKHMTVRNKYFAVGNERELVEREDVKAFLAETRACIAEKRALTNIGLTIPQVMLGLLRENIEGYSKLYKHVNVRAISGDGRLTIMGTIPEAIWTDCCANLNEMDLTFYDEEFNCWKVGGYYTVCNATLEDSDIDLANELMSAIGQGIGLALDKAILYGTGTRMPKGIVTRLVESSEPSGYPATARPWADLSSTNVKSIASTVKGADLFKEFIIDAGAAKSQYSRGNKFWAMNETTYTALISEAATIDASGAIVSGVNGVLPIVGGTIETLSFIPDNVIIGGYGDLYTLVERAGQKFATSEHIKFLADQTVFKGTARYDGSPSIAEGFVAIGINGTTPTATMTFAPDTANTNNTGA